MSEDGPENLTLRYLRQLADDVGGVRLDMHEVKGRLTSIEDRMGRMLGEMASIHGDFAGQSVRIDRLEHRLERIEQRLNLRDA